MMVRFGIDSALSSASEVAATPVLAVVLASSPADGRLWFWLVFVSFSSETLQFGHYNRILPNSESTLVVN